MVVNCCYSFDGILPCIPKAIRDENWYKRLIIAFIWKYYRLCTELSTISWSLIIVKRHRTDKHRLLSPEQLARVPPFEYESELTQILLASIIFCLIEETSVLLSINGFLSELDRRKGTKAWTNCHRSTPASREAINSHINSRPVPLLAIARISSKY